jgi:hypothetical protein
MSATTNLLLNVFPTTTSISISGWCAPEAYHLADARSLAQDDATGVPSTVCLIYHGGFSFGQAIKELVSPRWIAICSAAVFRDDLLSH